MLPQSPEPDRHPDVVPGGRPGSVPNGRRAVVRAAVSPSAAIVTAAGFGIGLLAQSITLAVVLAVVAWLGHMVVAIARSRRKGWRLPLVSIDPFAVSEPWRQYVRQAVASRQRFDQTVAGWPAGPLHDRLVLLQPRLSRAAEEVWAVAQQGAALDGTVRGVPTGAGRPSIDQLSTELRRVQAERQQQAPASDRQAVLARSEAAVAAQLRAARHSESLRVEVLDRLRLLTAQLDEAVTQLLALGLERPAGDRSVDETAGSVDALVEEIGALRQGLREAEAAAAGTDLPVEVPPGPSMALPPPGSRGAQPVPPVPGPPRPPPPTSEP